MNLFVVPIGCLASGPLSQAVGRRKTTMIATFPFVIAWLLFYFANNSQMLFIAMIMTGISGGLEAPILNYVAESSQPHLRGMLTSTLTVSVIFGVFTQMLTASLVNWRTAALINLVYPILCFLSLCMVPESPAWLACKFTI